MQMHDTVISAGIVAMVKTLISKVAPTRRLGGTFLESAEGVHMTFFTLANTRIITIGMFCLVYVTECRAQHVTNVESELRKLTIEKDASASKISRLYAALFERNIEQLPLLKTSESHSVAIQAAWQQVRVGATQKSGRFSASDGALSRFLGFIEGRLRINVPLAWNSTLLSASGSNVRRFGALQNSIKYTPTGWRGVRAPVGTRISIVDDKVIASLSDHIVRIPDEITSTRFPFISIGVLGSHALIAIHEENGYPHDVLFVDRKTGKTKWKSRSCGCKWGASMGLHVTRVVVSVEKDRAYVFGASTNGFYLHGFSTDNGDTTVRFSSRY